MVEKKKHHMNYDEFIVEVLEYNPKADKRLLKKAYDFAHKTHFGQKRASGETFFIHPLEVAKTLTKLRADSPTLAAALLHDSVEDGTVTIDEIQKEFGEEVALLVEGVTKITGQWFDTKEEYAAENLRKVLIATAKDIRVMLIKLADRMHNMRTLHHLRHDKQKRIAKETLDIYAPIAHKLGARYIKGELEDLALKVLDPENYQMLRTKIASKRKEREERTKQFIKRIKDNLKEVGIDTKIDGRAKYFYSIYQKMMREAKDFNEIYDLIAIRIITNTVPECYTALGIIHDLWKPMPKRFKDYISIPKANGYQSLHTSVVTENGRILEIQIRTKEMHLIAEQGIAAHWRYKGTERDKKFDRKINWLKQLLEWKRDSKTAKEFVESLKIDLFENEIVTFTPKGDPISLPENSTPVDFAYEIHTNVGKICSQAEVNGKIVSLDHVLKSGDIVHIITKRNAHPHRNWLSFVKTTKARSKIRSDLNIKGDFDKKSKEQQEDSYTDLIENMEFIGFTGKIPQIKLSKCCLPKYGEPVIAYLTKDKKITIHRKDCPNIHALKNAKHIPMRWKERESKNTVKLRLTVEDTPGVLAEILNMIAQKSINVNSIYTRSKKNRVAITILLDITSNDPKIDLVGELILHIRSLKPVLDIKQVK